ncbi:MAG: hypothetical protein ACFE9V_10415 [Candidatus Hodarchaeota archaeon]
MDYKFITLDNKDHLTNICLNRPKVLNAINAHVSFELENAQRQILQYSHYIENLLNLMILLKFQELSQKKENLFGKESK